MKKDKLDTLLDEIEKEVAKIYLAQEPDAEERVTLIRIIDAIKEGANDSEIASIIHPDLPEGKALHFLKYEKVKAYLLMEDPHFWKEED